MTSDRAGAAADGAEEPRWLSPEERDAWLCLSAIMFQLPGQLENQLQRDSGLGFVEYMVLAMLSEAPDRSHRMSDLAAATFTGQSRLSRIVARTGSGMLGQQTGWSKHPWFSPS